MVGYGSGDGVGEEEQGGAAGRIKRHTNREAFLLILVGMGCRLKRVAFSKPVLGVISSIFIRKEV